MQVGSNVRLTRLLGEGGMGSIWVAEHLSLQTQVAVKLLHQHVAERPEVRARFQREAAAAAQLRSPHVVQIFDYGVTQHGVPFIVMELLDGEDLAQHIDRLGARPLSVVVEIVNQVARALAVAHARGVVHRDIKPENVFLTKNEGEVFVKLLDFGIAKRAEDAVMNVTNTNFMLGTPNFMSPEQLMNPKSVDFRTDLWSVAVVAYAALTGKLPFYGESVGALCVAVNAGDFVPVTRLRPELPLLLDAWFERAFQRDPEGRFVSVQDLANEFESSSGINERHRWSSADLDGAEGSRRLSSAPPAALSSVAPAGSSSTPPSMLSEPSRQSSSFNASLTQATPTRKSQFLTVLMVVLTSMASSVATTVLILAPSSLGRVLDTIAGNPPRDPRAPANLASPARASGFDADPSTLAGPKPAAAPPEIASNAPEVVVEPAEEAPDGEAASSPEATPKAQKPASARSRPKSPPAKPGTRGSGTAKVKSPKKAAPKDPPEADYGL
jgi:serine/threonine-protein kinase